MKLPNAEQAIVDIRKLRSYCLNPLHDEGKHKARVFMSALGMTTGDADILRTILLDAVKTYEAHPGYRDTYGQRYTIDFPLAWRGQEAQVRSAWIIEHGYDAPRLTSCYVI